MREKRDKTKREKEKRYRRKGRNRDTQRENYWEAEKEIKRETQWGDKER